MCKGLVLDGGGVFGIGQAEILSKVTNLDKFDFIAGTSIGSVVGALVASGDPAVRKCIPSFFDSDVPQIFNGYWYRKYNVFTPKYPDRALNATLKRLFPGFLKDVKIPLFVTAVDLNGRSLKVFFSGDPIDGRMPLWEVIRRAVAAETYFCPFNGMADGGILANNPVMVGIAGAQSHMGIDPEELEVCSIGTGQRSYNQSIGTTKGWTLVGWGGYILDALLDGASSTMHEFFATQLDLKNYLRVQFLREEAWDMDNPKMVGVARDAWAADIAKAIPQVEAF